MNDDALIRAVAEGDDVALRALFERHAHWIAARLRRSWPRTAVEDVLQETFVAVWKSARSYKGEGEVAAWIWGIARRQAVTSLRRARNELDLSFDAPSNGDPANDAAVHADLSRLMDTLGPPGGEARELARLLWEEGHSVAEVAAAMGIPEGTVKSRAFKARQALRVAFQEGGYL